MQLSTCADCGYTVRTSRKSYFCPSCKVSIGGITRRSTAAAKPQRAPVLLPYNHWTPLHRYAVENHDRWDPGEAAGFVERWLRDIPQLGCSCRRNFQPILQEFGVVSETSEQFARRAWLWHDLVSAEIGNLRISWRECEELYGNPWAADANPPRA